METLEWIMRSIAILFFMSLAMDTAVACSGGGESTQGQIKAFQCTGTYGELQCNNEKWCYSEAQRCNDVKDCPDGSDEDIHHCGKILY